MSGAISFGRPRGTILAYHAVADCLSIEDPANLIVSVAAFAAQMLALKRFARVVSLDDMIRGLVPRGRPAVAITFDDGYRSVLEEAVPILKRYGFPATVFVPTAWLGRFGGWYASTLPALKIMNAEELVQLERAGVRVESHGHEHIDVGQATDADVEEDLRASVEAFEANLGRRPRYLAYPYGSSSPAVERAAARAGFEAAFSIDELHRGRYAWRRVQVTPLDGQFLFALKAVGAYLPVRRSRVGSGIYRIAKPLIPRGPRRQRDTSAHR